MPLHDQIQFGLVNKVIVGFPDVTSSVSQAFDCFLAKLARVKFAQVNAENVILDGLLPR